MPQKDEQSWDAPGVAAWLDADWSERDVDPALSALVDLVEQHHRSGSILEAGCGTGRTYEALMRRVFLHPFPYIGVDVSEAMLERARARYPEIDARRQDLRELSFTDWSFGSVVCTDVLHHLPEIESAVAEMMRVARDHLFLMLWLRKSGAPPLPVIPKLVVVPEFLVRARFYELPRSDEEVIAACEVAGGRVLDLHVLEGDRHDIGVFRVGVRR